jgi:hypothetical protein
MRASLDKLAGEALGGPPQELTTTIKADLAKWGPIVKALNLSTD